LHRARYSYALPATKVGWTAVNWDRTTLDQMGRGRNIQRPILLSLKSDFKRVWQLGISARDFFRAGRYCCASQKSGRYCQCYSWI